MAAARHQCSYLVNLHVNDFLHVGGDPKWLNGLENAPQKLQNLGELNKVLAHRPWLITKEHIEGLLKAEEHSWSLAELVHAVVLLTHYHSLASFTFGCGISPEIHCDGGHTFRPPSVSNYCICDITNGNHSVDEMPVNSAENVSVSDSFFEVEALMEKMRQLQECRDEEEASQEEMASRFEIEKERACLSSLQMMMKLHQQEMYLVILRILVMAIKISLDMGCMFQHFVSRTIAGKIMVILW